MGAGLMGGGTGGNLAAHRRGGETMGRQRGMRWRATAGLACRPEMRPEAAPPPEGAGPGTRGAGRRGREARDAGGTTRETPGTTRETPETPRDPAEGAGGAGGDARDDGDASRPPGAGCRVRGGIGCFRANPHGADDSGAVGDAGDDAGVDADSTGGDRSRHGGRPPRGLPPPSWSLLSWRWLIFA